MRTEASQLWETVDGLVAQVPAVAALRHHRLELLAARQRRAEGREIDPALRAAERLAAMRAVSVPHLLELIRSAVDGPIVLMKGPEAAASYRFPDCRPFGDLDILAPDTDAAFAALLRAGFKKTGTCDAAHHAPPLMWPGVPLVIELHKTIKYVSRLSAPPIDDLLRWTRPSRTGVDGVDGFAPAAHAVLLAAHSWAHGPLQLLGQLIDVAAVLDDAVPGEADEIARRWGCDRLWRTTCAAVDGVLRGHAPSMPLLTWARHLAEGREPRVAERSVARIAAPAWSLPRRAVPAAIGTELLNVVQRYEWETRDEHLVRSRQALRHPFRTVSEFRA